MRYLCILTIFFSWQSSLSAHSFSVSGVIEGHANGSVKLAAIRGERLVFLDSTRTHEKGNFVIPVRETYLPGMYRLQFGKNKFINLVLGHENIRLTTTFSDPSKDLKIVESFENTLFRDVQKKEAETQEKLALLQPVIDYYPLNTEFYQEAAKEYESIQELRNRFYEEVIRKNPDLFVSKIAAIKKEPFIKASMKEEERLSFLKSHYFDGIDFTDTNLFRSNVLTGKVFAYMSLYSNPKYSRKQLEEAFIRAIHIILFYASANPYTYDFIAEFLIGGFEKFHFDEVLTFIAENYESPDTMQTNPKREALKHKLEVYKKIAIGKGAPDFETVDLTGNKLHLRDFQNEYLLLVFYASDCPHCSEFLPDLHKYYKSQASKKMEVVAISLDKDRDAWEKYVRDGKYDWINASDLKGWDSPVADDYNIYATPTFILLDRNKTIVLKPLMVEEITSFLKNN